MEAHELAHPARAASIAKIVVSAGYTIAVFTVADRVPQLYAGFVFVPLCVLTVIRHIRILTLKPFVRATPDGLDIRVYRFRFLVPWVFEDSWHIPWNRLQGAIVRTVTVNGLATSSLRLEFPGGPCEIDPGVFEERARDLQQVVLDYTARGGRPPQDGPTPASEAIAARNRERFERPVVLDNRASLTPALIALALTGGAVAGAVADPDDWYLWGCSAVMALVLTLALIASFAALRKVRHVELRAAGLAFGPRRGRLWVVPWHDIEVARVSTTNGRAHDVTVTLVDGSTLVLHGRYGRDFAEIRDLIDPP